MPAGVKIAPPLNTCVKNEGVGDRDGCKLGTRGGDRVSRLEKVRALAPWVPDSSFLSLSIGHKIPVEAHG